MKSCLTAVCAISIDVLFTRWMQIRSIFCFISAISKQFRMFVFNRTVEPQLRARCIHVRASYIKWILSLFIILVPISHGSKWLMCLRVSLLSFLFHFFFLRCVCCSFFCFAWFHLANERAHLSIVVTLIFQNRLACKSNILWFIIFGQSFNVRFTFFM